MQFIHKDSAIDFDSYGSYACGDNSYVYSECCDGGLERSIMMKIKKGREAAITLFLEMIPPCHMRKNRTHNQPHKQGQYEPQQGCVLNGCLVEAIEP